MSTENELKNKAKYFINTEVSEKMFNAVNKRHHQLEKTRSTYVRSLIAKDLKSSEEKDEQQPS